MYTLQEFIRFTKGWEYIIAIIGILLFLAFWRELSGSRSGKGEEEVVRQDRGTSHRAG